jgi:hypothetical protein
MCALTACEPPTETVTPPRPDPASQAIGYARSIVSDPSNWKGNTILLTDLGAAAQDLGISDTQQFKEFDSAAQDLIRFGTTWISSLDEGATTRLRNELSHITNKTEAAATTQINAGAGSVPSGAGAHITVDSKKDSERVQTEAERAIYTSIDGLRAAQADEFGRLYSRAQGAFRALRLLLQPKQKEALTNR